MRHFSYFNKYIMNPINRYGYIGDGRKAMIRLKKEVLDKMMLRRTKVERASDIKLPPLHVSVEKLTLTESEMDFYECIYKNSRSKFDTFVEKGVLLNNYAHIFQLLSRLRQTLDHPYLVVHGKLSHSQLPQLLATTDCLVLPSRLESFGMVVVEALAAGVPVIVSDHAEATHALRIDLSSDIFPQHRTILSSSCPLFPAVTNQPLTSGRTACDAPA